MHWLLFFSVKRVKTFKLHPNYNINAKAKEGVKEFYDYDVALIQLEEDVQISSAVRWEQLILDLIGLSLQRVAPSLCAHFPGFRPICIPCTQETSSALGLVGNSTCKQQGERTPADMLQIPFHNLKSSKVPCTVVYCWSPQFLLCMWDLRVCSCPHSVLLSGYRRSSQSNLTSFLSFRTYRGNTAEDLSWKTFLPDQEKENSAQKGSSR